MRPAVFLPFLISACVAATPSAPNAILAIGDSVMAWNGDRGIPEAVQTTLGRPVVDHARSGAQLTNPNGLAGAVGFDISRQFGGGQWDWVILTGGGNDLRGVCKTGGEKAVLDGLIDDRLTGDIPRLIARIRATDAKVGFVGYYDGAEAGATGFTPCQSAFDTINARMTRLAADDPGLLFFDAGTVIDAADQGLYADDLIHPSQRGATLIGRGLARAMLAFERR